MIHRASIIYFSPCGGTKQVADALAKGVNLPITSHDYTQPSKRQAKDFGPEDFVFFIFPVYGGRMPRNAGHVLSKVTGKDTACAIVAVYGNRAYEGALIDVHKLTSAKGFKPVGAIAAVAEHSIAPQIATGRPDAQDKATLGHFASEMLRAAADGKNLTSAPGAYPEWERPEGIHLFPITETEKCISCGQCADICPAEAISPENPDQTDWDKCILCAACAKYCPEAARFMGTSESREYFKPHLVTAAEKRREPELFLGE